MTVNRQLVIQTLIIILMIVNFALLLHLALQRQCPEILAPQVNHNGVLLPCTKDPSSTPSRLVWNCP